jgi:microcystin-dependent protein
MATYRPLIVNAAANQIQELASGDSLTGITTVTATTFIGNGIVPVGAVFHFAASTAPTGYLKANGDTVPNGSGTIQGVTADFSALYAILGTTYGSAGTLPDLRGEFIRGWTDGKVGIDTQTTFGRSQGFAVQNVTGEVWTAADGNAGGFTDASGAFSVSNADNILAAGGATGPYYRTLSFSLSGGGAQTATETRPRNISLLACIKY